jgi:hypothetical protein
MYNVYFCSLVTVQCEIVPVLRTATAILSTVNQNGL